MYNRLTFENQLSNKYLQQNIILIQNRKSRFPEFKTHIQKKRALTSVISDKQIQLQNKKLVQKLVQVKCSPAFVRKMYMGDGHSLQTKRSKSIHLATSKVAGHSQSIKLKSQDDNEHSKRNIQKKKPAKAPLVLPLI